MSRERLNDLRVRHGLKPIDALPSVGDADVERNARGLMNNVSEVDNRIDAINAKPRAVNADEVAAFGMRARQLSDEYDLKNAQIAEAMERGNSADVARLTAEADAIHRRIDDVTSALRKTGSITGRVLRLFGSFVDRKLSLRRLTEEMHHLVWGLSPKLLTPLNFSTSQLHLMSRTRDKRRET